jgi:8-oxo-dGTP diphosphatase
MPAVSNSPFYRVTSRAIILVDDKIVLVKDGNGDWQIPGGGWEHDESFENCMKREVLEELSVNIVSVGPLLFSYRQVDKRGYTSLRLAAKAEVDSTDFVASDGMLEVSSFSKDEFLALTLCPGEGPVQDYADLIWHI